MSTRVLVRIVASAVAVVVALGGLHHAGAQVGAANTYVTPFPPGDTYRLTMIGDFMAEGMLGPLAEGLSAADAKVQIQRKVRGLQGLLKADLDEELRTLDGELQKERTNIAIVMLGNSDRVNHRTSQGKRIGLGTEEWRYEYGRRVDLLMKALKRRNVAVYWAGLPPLRRSEANDDARMINDIVRERAYLNGIRYVDVFVAFADEDGDFTTVGNDVTGKSRALRAPDGVSFTPAGSQKLAYFVEEEIKRDIGLAKAARGVPLAGTEAEQQRIAASVAKAAAPKLAPWQTSTSPGQPKAAKSAGAVDAQAELGRVTLKGGAPGQDGVSVDIIRPAVPATIVALITRREGLDRTGQPFGDGQVRFVGDFAMIESLSAADGAAAQGKRRAVSVQSPFFRAIIKGERLAPRPGRADDFSWPRPEEAAPAPAPAPPLPQPASEQRKPQPRGKAANPR